MHSRPGPVRAPRLYIFDQRLRRTAPWPVGWRLVCVLAVAVCLIATAPVRAESTDTDIPELELEPKVAAAPEVPYGSVAVRVTDAYVDMHTGPGRGYPVFYTAGSGDTLVLLKRRTHWIKVRESRGYEGWVPVDRLSTVTTLDGDAVVFPRPDRQRYLDRRWEVGFNAGEFGGASGISGYVGFAVTQNIGLQVEATQILGDFSDGTMGNINILMRPFPQWRASPYFTLGTGIIRTKPHSTIVQAEDRRDEIAHVGVGADVYLTDRFFLRLEYKRHTLLSSRDQNEEVNQWKAGFSVFF